MKRGGLKRESMLCVQPSMDVSLQVSSFERRVRLVSKPTDGFSFTFYRTGNSSLPPPLSPPPFPPPFPPFPSSLRQRNGAGKLTTVSSSFSPSAVPGHPGIQLFSMFGFLFGDSHPRAVYDKTTLCFFFCRKEGRIIDDLVMGGKVHPPPPPPLLLLLAYFRREMR
jgi:hypothetical protein